MLSQGRVSLSAKPGGSGLVLLGIICRGHSSVRELGRTFLPSLRPQGWLSCTKHKTIRETHSKRRPPSLSSRELTDTNWIHQVIHA